MNKLLETITKVEASPEYATFREKDPSAFLAHVFLMIEELGTKGFQVGYYDPGRKLMTTFALERSGISMMPDLEVFQRPGSEILPLDPVQVGFDDDHMLAKAAEAQKTLYPGNVIIKQIFILQHLSIGQVFNISLITKAFKVINFKFDSATGDLKKHHMDSLLSVTS